MAALSSYADAIRQRALSGARPLVTSIDGVDLDDLSGRDTGALLPDDDAQGRVRQSSGRERHSSVSMLETPQLFGRATPILPTLAENAQCVGWLMKKASRFPWGWNERYFACVPASGVLFYFSDDGSGVLSVRGRLQLKGVREGSPRPLFEFEVDDTPGASRTSSGTVERTIVVRPLDLADRSRWINTVSEGLASRHLAYQSA